LKNREKQSKIQYTGLGLVFGTALAAGVVLALGKPIFWAGIGTGAGLVFGAILDSVKNRQSDQEDGK